MCVCISVSVSVNVCICVCVRVNKEGNVLFNEALNTFYLWLYGITHMVKDHSDSERITHTRAFVTPAMEH